MPLNAEDVAEIIRLHQTGHQASDLVPFLRNLVTNNRLNDISEAISQFVQLADTSRPQIRSYLVARIPALIMNYYWTSQMAPVDYDHLIRYTLENNDWSIRIRNAVDFDGDLVAVVTQIENEARLQDGANQ